MSTGSIIGGIVGGVAGFFIGGPVGAAVGISLGMGAGALIDPIDMNSNVGAPEAQSVTAAGEGKVIADLLGTSKLQGNIIWFGNERAEEITQETQGGKGGGGNESQTVGYNYFVSWALGLCMGEVDTIYTIWAGDDLVWSGVQENPGTGASSSLTLLNNKGSAKIYWGSSNQVADTVMGDEALNYRNLCYIVFDDYNVGQDPRVPSLSVIIKKTPDISGFSSTVIGDFDYNPAAASYYIMKNMLNIKSDDLDLQSFTSAATTLSTELFGISLLMNNPMPALTFQESILRHVDAHLSWGGDGVTTTTTSTTP